jgi:hypothetical protein
MRRDLCYFYPIPVEPVFNAFVQAANQKFGKQCKIDAYKTVNFGLNYSFKYNMNGGALTIHFMPYNNGTAIDMRYTIVQAFGARYQKHADDVLIFTNAVLGAQAQRIQLDINEFLAYETGVSSAPLNTVPQPVQPPMQTPVQQAPVQQAHVQQAPVQQAPVQPAAQPNFCMKCGAPVVPNAAFCIKCGFKLR